MTPTTKQQDFKRRKENVDKVNSAIILMERDIKSCIKKMAFAQHEELIKLEKEIELYTRLLSGLLIVWSESMIKWLYYEHGVFNNNQIKKLLNKKALQQKWTCALTAAFYYSLSNSAYNSNKPLASKNDVLNSSVISTKDKKKYIKIYTLIETKLVPAIGIRNKIQHGDWGNAYSKNSTQEHVYDSHLTTTVENENILIIKLKRKQFKLLYDIIKDLAAFKNTGKFKLDNSSSPFSYFFGRKYGQILNLQKQIDNSDYEKYKNTLIKKQIRGLEWKKKNTNSFLSYIKNIFNAILNK